MLRIGYCLLYLLNKYLSSYGGMFIKTKSMSIKTKAIWSECSIHYKTFYAQQQQHIQKHQQTRATRFILTSEEESIGGFPVMVKITDILAAKIRRQLFFVIITEASTHCLVQSFQLICYSQRTNATWQYLDSGSSSCLMFRKLQNDRNSLI